MMVLSLYLKELKDTCSIVRSIYKQAVVEVLIKPTILSSHRHQTRNLIGTLQKLKRKKKKKKNFIYNGEMRNPPTNQGDLQSIDKNH